MKYLIIKCIPLNDDWECDANRTPMFSTNNWKNLKLEYLFEVWEQTPNGYKLIKNYE